jgi:hypothetical protein
VILDVDDRQHAMPAASRRWRVGLAQAAEPAFLMVCA